MQMFTCKGAMYAKIDPQKDFINTAPVELAGGTLKPGVKITKFGGRRKAAEFEMLPGHYLEYVGYVDIGVKTLLFSPDGKKIDNTYYAFFLIDAETMVFGGPQSMADICCKEIKFVY